MDNLLTYMEAGNPTLLLVDPLPVINLGLSPSEKSGGNTNPFQRNQGPPPKPKGNIQDFMTNIGVAWNSSQLAWDAYNPHPDLAQIPPEIVFIGQGNENPEAFNAENSVSSGLQELVLLYPGNIRRATSKDTFLYVVKNSVLTTEILLFGVSIKYFLLVAEIGNTFENKLPFFR